MNRYIESKASVTAVQFWNTESCMEELKQLGVEPINIRIKDGTPRLILNSILFGEMESKEGDYVVKTDGDAGGITLAASKFDFEKKYRVYEASEEADSEPEAPLSNYPSNRILNAFPRPDALNEIYSTGEVDHRGVPVNYSIWRGNHSIMGLTGILFQNGIPGDFHDPELQEGVEDTDLLEMVHDRLVQLQDYVENGEWIVQAILSIEVAIKNILAYQAFCRDIGDNSGC